MEIKDYKKLNKTELIKRLIDMQITLNNVHNSSHQDLMDLQDELLEVKAKAFDLISKYNEEKT